MSPSHQPSPEQLEALASFVTAIGLPVDLRARVLRSLAGTADKPEKFLTTRDAAALIPIHPKTLLHLGRRGLLHPIRRGTRTVRWRESEITSFRDGGIS